MYLLNDRFEHNEFAKPWNDLILDKETAILQIETKHRLVFSIETYIPYVVNDISFSF